MIHFFATARHLYTFREFFDSWGTAVRPAARLISYEYLSLGREIPSGACVFCDLERLRPAELGFARFLTERLLARPEHYVVLNRPDRYSGRVDLARLLYECGVNRFQILPVAEARGRVRFPAFLRSALDHRGPIGGLLHSEADLDRALARLPLGHRLPFERLVAVEYCDSADASGVFRKYSVMRIGDRLIPRHVLFSRNWQTKYPEIVSETTAAEEAAFVNELPHAVEVRRAFDLAGIDYGRIDYGVQDGQIQVWEINTNPVIVPKPGRLDPRRLTSQSESARQIVDALTALGGEPTALPVRPFRSRGASRWKAVQWLGRVYSPFRR